MGEGLQRRVGFWGASAIMVGVIIGSGIFRQPPIIAGYLGSPWIMLGFWITGGLLSLFGAMTCAELATRYPQSGGIYVFLREGFGRPVAFVFGWTYLLISKPFAAAGIATFFGESVNHLFGTHWDHRITTTLVLVGLTAINTFGVDIGAGVAKVLTSAKVVALLVIIALAVILRKGSAANFEVTAAPVPFWLAIAPVMAGIMWTYDGWSDVGAIAGEVKEPRRRLPWIYCTGTLMVTLIYIAINATYVWMMPLAEMRKTDDVAPIVVGRLVGDIGGTVVLVIILISTLGSTHGSIITGARVTYAQACDGLLFRFLGRVHPRFGTPAIALWAQLTFSLIALWLLSDFEKLANGFMFTMWIFYGLATASLFVIRRKHPGESSSFRCWGYPVVPAVFVLVAAGMTALTIIGDLRLEDASKRGMSTLPWLGVLVAGVPVYYIWRALTRGTSPP